MSKDTMIYFDDGREPMAYDDTYDILIHCDSEEARQKTIERITSMQWISCSERLPDEADYKGCSECIDGAVWYYTDKGAMGLGYYYESTKTWSTTYDECPYGEVIAWMPLPEPYKGGEHG